MATQRTPRTTSRPARRVAAARPAKVDAKATATDVRKQVSDAVRRARDDASNRMHAGIGLISRLRRQGDERFAELVAEGKRVQPRFDKAIDELKSKLRPDPKAAGAWRRLAPDLSSFKLDTGRFSRKAIEQSFEARMADSLHRIGLPTRKEVQALARKVDKLVAAQAA